MRLSNLEENYLNVSAIDISYEVGAFDIVDNAFDYVGSKDLFG